MTRAAGRQVGATGIVLLTLAAGQFVMALDTTVMLSLVALLSARGIPTVQPGAPSSPRAPTA